MTFTGSILLYIGFPPLPLLPIQTFKTILDPRYTLGQTEAPPGKGIQVGLPRLLRPSYKALDERRIRVYAANPTPVMRQASTSIPEGGSMSNQEFLPGLKIYTATKDSHGDTRQINIHFPADVLNSAERFMRDNNTWLSLHQFVLSATIQGFKEYEKHGMAQIDPVVWSLLEVQSDLQVLEAKQKLVKGLEKLYCDARSNAERKKAIEKIRAEANKQDDPELGEEIRRIIR